MEGLLNLGGSMGSGWSGLGSLIGGIGGAYGAWQQGKAAQGLLDLQKKNYYREVEKEKKAQDGLDTALNASFGA